MNQGLVVGESGKRACDAAFSARACPNSAVRFIGVPVSST